MNMITKHFMSYRYAMRGVWLAMRYEPNMLFHLAGGLAVVILNFLLDVSRQDWLITLVLVALTWSAEVFNTSIEKLADRVTREQDPIIGQVKDLAAGAVLIIAFFAVVCAAIIYVPYWWG